MSVPIGEVQALYRYPVKSLAGERLDTAELGWHGVAGDRRFAFRRLGDRAGFPWLTATKLPDLLRFVPQRRGNVGPNDLPTHVRTPRGRALGVFSDELALDIGERLGAPVEMTHLDRGIFDAASVSVVTTATINAVANLAAERPDVRRFRPNVVVASRRSLPFEEDAWVAGSLTFGAPGAGPAVHVTERTERCALVNHDPDSARSSPDVLKAIVRENDNRLGAYGTVTRCGRVAVGTPVFFEPAREP